MPGFHLSLLKTIFALFFFLVASSSTATSLRLEGESWESDASDAEVVTHLGRPALALRNGRAWKTDHSFGEGIIEFDVAYDESLSFAGIALRAKDDKNFEEIYLRAHLNQKPDALQYAPHLNGLSAWQIYADSASIAAVNHKFDAWNKVKVIVVGDRAEIYVNSSKPVLSVPRLATGLKGGGVGFWSLSLDDKTIYFSNFRSRSLSVEERASFQNRNGLVGAKQAKAASSLPAGLRTQWKIAAPINEEVVEGLTVLPAEFMADVDWQNLAAEKDGFINIARRFGIQDGKNTAMLRLVLDADSEMVREMRFGYSDRVRIYLNGGLLYSGIAGWKSRDYRFLGTVGFFDSVGLRLMPGRNEILIAVSETFGGWAWGAALN